MKYLLSAALGAVLLAGCATHQGQLVQQVQFKVDGGKTISLPIVRGGALPAENEDYKIEVAGYIASLKPGDASQSEIRQSFSFFAKKSPVLESVRIEQVDPVDGRLQLVLQDDAPVLKSQSWIGKTGPAAATREASPWLYSADNSTFLFKFTIKAKDSPAVVLYQPSFFNKATKDAYMRALRVPASK